MSESPSSSRGLMRFSAALVVNLFPGQLQLPAFASARITTQMASISLICLSKMQTNEYHIQGKLRHFPSIYCNASLTSICCIFRVRINKEFEDGDSCTVTLKDRFKPQEEKEKLWYDRAFGPLRNIMRVELSFTPPPADVPPNKFQFFAQVGYNMFPEMREEFNEDDYQMVQYVPMEFEHGDHDLVEYFLETELPYGHVEPKIFFRPIDGQAAAAGDQNEPQPLWPEMNDYFRSSCIPEPVSREQQQINDDLEEKDNKEKERAARQAQKELEQRKAKQKNEAQ